MNEKLNIISEQEVFDRKFSIYGTLEMPLFLAKDVANWIEHSDVSTMTRSIDDDEKLIQTLFVSGQKRDCLFLTEDGVYEVLMQSRKPIAKQFKKEVKRILHSIRKHGAYMTPETLEAAILNPDTMIKLCTALKDEQDKRKALEAANAALTVDNTIMQPKAAYFDELVDRALNTGIRETAKELGVKEKDFVKFLLDKRYLYRDKKGNLQSYAQYADDLFVLKECFNEKTQWAGTQLLVTPKGRETFRLLFVGAA